MAADLPTPLSYPRILGDMLRSLTADTGIRRFRKGNPLLSVLEAAARGDARDLAHVFEAVEALDIDNAEGALLASIGFQDDVDQLPARRASVTLTLGDSSFQKVSSRIYRGLSAPIAGTSAIRVDDADAAPASGTIYIGRGTPRVEGPLAYASKTHNSGYWTFNLTSSTTQFHNWGEEVVVGRGGDRVIDVGQVVQTPPSSLTPPVQFSVAERRTLLDGEVVLEGVPANCTVEGEVGNVPEGSVSAFAGGLPWPGATVTNPARVTDGRDVDDSDSYRDRIKKRRNSKQRGTDLAIEQAVLGQVAPDENRMIATSRVVRRTGAISKLYIDDGTGYEGLTTGVALEVLEASAGGGETEFQVAHRPVAKAYLMTVDDGPFPLDGGETLALEVGGIFSSHRFSTEDISPGAASAYEIAASINGDPSCLFEARTVGSGKRVVLEARADVGEDLAAVDPEPGLTDAAPLLSLRSGRAVTTDLYLNDRPLIKDRVAAAVTGLPFARWENFSGGQTIAFIIDQTAIFAVGINDQTFVDAETGFASVGRNSPEAWRTVLDHTVPGATVTLNGDRLVVTSNRTDNRASVEILDCSLVSHGLFEISSAAGVASDYQLDRGTGEIRLAKPLAANDRLTLGTAWPGAFLETTDVPTSTLAANGEVWLALDAAATRIPVGVLTTTLMTSSFLRSLPHSYHLELRAAGAEAFADVRAGDWAVISDSGAPATLRRAWRVLQVLPDGGGLMNRLVFERRAAAVPRVGHRATALQPLSAGALPRVLVTGGYTTATGFDNGRPVGRGVTVECEIYDPNDGSWIRSAPMAIPRAGHTATLLQSGKVLVTGGDNPSGALASTEVYDPATDTWASGPVMGSAVTLHAAVLLASGRVLIAGGRVSGSGFPGTVEYDPGTGTLINTASMTTGRWGHQLVLLPTGAGTAGIEANNVLAIGGHTSGFVRTATMERYTVSTHVWAARTSMPLNPGSDGTRAFFGAVSLDTQHVMVAGDEWAPFGFGPNASNYAIYTVNTNAWIGTTDLPNFTAFVGKDLAKLPNGQVLAPYAFSSGVPSIQPQMHLRYASGSWATVADSASFSGDHHRIGVASAVLGTINRVVCIGGVSIDNFQESNADERLMETCSAPELFDATTGWSYPDPIQGTWTPLDSGISVVRTSSDLHHITIPTGASYTASTIAAVLDSAVAGASASTYRTKRIRWQSNTRGGGDILAVASTIPAALPLPAGPDQGREQPGASVVTYAPRTPWGFQVYHAYAVADSNTDHVQVLHIAEPDHDQSPDPALQLYERELPPPPAGIVTSLRRWHSGPNPAFWAFPPNLPLATGADPRVPEYGLAGWRTPISTWQLSFDIPTGRSDDVTIGVRSAPAADVCAHQPLVVGAPFSLRPIDELSMVIDGDVRAGRFDLPTARKTKPVGAYAQQIALRDGDGADALWVAFGKPYNWNDFAVHMHARVKSHPASASQKVLWRYYRTGSEGELAIMRYAYPAAANSPVSTAVTLDQNLATEDLAGRIRAFVDVVLGSGPARAASNIPTDARIAVARTRPSSDLHVYDVYAMVGWSVTVAERLSSGGTTRLRLQIQNFTLPTDGPTGTGLSTGDVVWFDSISPSPTTLLSGTFAIASVDPFNSGSGTQNIYVPANTLHNGTAAWSLTTITGSSVSMSGTGKASWDPAIANGDLMRFTSLSAVPTSYQNTTGRVTLHNASTIRLRMLDPTGAGVIATPVQYSYGTGAGISVFAGPTATASAVAAAVTALAASATSPSPLTGVATGTGSGVLSLASWDEADSASSGYPLRDGVNYVQRTIPAPTSSDETQFLLRLPVETSLTASDSDWTNEEVWLMPILPTELSRWWSTPAVTGLSTLADVAVANDGQSVRVESLTAGTVGSVRVLGGSANSSIVEVAGTARIPTRNAGQPLTAVVTVQATRADHLSGGSWVRVDYDEVVKSPSFWTNSTTATVTAGGRWVFSVSPYTVLRDIDNLRVHFEILGDFVALHIPKTENSDCPLPSDAAEWGYVYICPATGFQLDLTTFAPEAELPDASQANRGVYQIVRYTVTPLGATVWIQNPGAVTEVSLARVKLLSETSTVPGDKFIVGTDRFGAANKRTWTVTEVGTATPGGVAFGDFSVTVSADGAVPNVVGTPVTFDADTLRCQLRRAAGSMVKQVLTVTPNQQDGTYTDVQLDTATGIQALSAATSARLVALDKLGMPVAPTVGVDGYAYHNGLLGQANRVIYGDPADEVTYPGFEANGGRITPVPPRIRRVKLEVGARVRTGAKFQDIAERIRSEITAAVNRTPEGQGCPFTTIDGRCKDIPGLEALSFASPVFSTSSDSIPCAPGEKLRILDPQRDITVSQVGVATP